MWEALHLRQEEGVTTLRIPSGKAVGQNSGGSREDNAPPLCFHCLPARV
jgi:hypothetical protein